MSCTHGKRQTHQEGANARNGEESNTRAEGGTLEELVEDNNNKKGAPSGARTGTEGDANHDPDQISDGTPSLTYEWKMIPASSIATCHLS